MPFSVLQYPAYKFTVEVQTNDAPRYPIRTLISIVNTLTSADEVTLNLAYTASDGSSKTLSATAYGKNLVFDLGLNTVFSN